VEDKACHADDTAHSSRQISLIGFMPIRTGIYIKDKWLPSEK